MPQPHKGPQVEYGPKAVAECPDAAISFATVIADWALVEDDVARLYAFLMSKWSDQLPTTSYMPAHPVGMLTFETLQTLNQRLSLLASLAKWALDGERAQEVVNAIDKIRRRARERNIVAHGLWGLADDAPGCLVLVNRFGCDMIYSAKDFEGMSDRIRTLHYDLHKLMLDLIKHVSIDGWRKAEAEEQPYGMLLNWDPALIPRP